MTEHIVFISGVWDLLHRGHCNVLERAKELGDLLVVGVITDEFACAYKGKRPVRNFEQRCDDVAALPCVDAIVPHHDFMDLSKIQEYKVTIRAVGPEYGKYPEQKECRAELEKLGIKFVVLPRTPGISTTVLRKENRK